MKKRKVRIDWIDGIGIVGLILAGFCAFAARTWGMIRWDEPTVFYLQWVGVPICLTLWGGLRLVRRRKWVEVEVPDGPVRPWYLRARVVWVDWIGIAGIFCCVVADRTQTWELIPRSSSLAIGGLGLLACVVWVPLRLSYLAFRKTGGTGDLGSSTPGAAIVALKPAHRQLTGMNCNRCDRRITGDIEAEFCSACGSPVHFRCVNPPGNGELPSRCSRCGADPTKALAADYAGG